MNYAILKAELADDPLGQGYAGKTDAEVAALLNTADQERLVSIPSSELLAWSAGAGRLQRIEDACNDAENSAELRSMAKAAHTMILRDETSLDLSLPDRSAMLDALVAYGVLTVADKTSLLALATQSLSRATDLRLGVVKVGHVQIARRVRD